MGVLRFFLALSVAWTHAELPYGFSGELCVTIFFVISGFYIALVLNENKAYSNELQFYTQRGMRIFPVYWTVLFLSYCFSYYSNILGQTQAHIDFFLKLGQPVYLGLIWLISQLFIIGQDIFLFLEINSTGDISFQPDLTYARNPLHQINLIPQAWSLSIELMFYVLAPFILRRSILLLIVLLVGSVLIRLNISWFFGFSSDPWTTRFLPSELSFFVLGALAYRFVIPFKAKERIFGLLKYFIFVSIVVTGLLVNNFGKTNQVTLFAMVPLVVFGVIASIPLLFILTKKNKLDITIGELSYPLYVCHIFVFEVGHFFYGSSVIIDIGLVVVAIIFSFLLMYFIDKPVQTYRHRLIKTKN